MSLISLQQRIFWVEYFHLTSPPLLSSNRKNPLFVSIESLAAIHLSGGQDSLAEIQILGSVLEDRGKILWKILWIVLSINCDESGKQHLLFDYYEGRLIHLFSPSLKNCARKEREEDWKRKGSNRARYWLAVNKMAILNYREHNITWNIG